MKEIWDQKFSGTEYLFGKEPNEFFKDKIEKLHPGNALFIAEGEGRNAVFAAQLGWNVDANDFSSVGRDKALSLANENNVNINYEIGDALELEYKNNFYDLIVIINFHIEENNRKDFYNKIVNSLKSGGIIILQVFDKEQIKMNSGGPSDVDLLYNLEDVIENFIDLNFEYLNKEYAPRVINGENKKAATIRFVGSKL